MSRSQLAVVALCIPAQDGHLHDAWFLFEGPDEIRTHWSFWKDAKPGDHVADVHEKRVR